MSTLMKRGKSMYMELKEEIGKGYTTQLHDKVSCLWLWALAPAPAIPQQHSPACHYESETALKGVERRWEALAPVATQRL